MREVSAPWEHGVVLICNNQRPDGSAKPSCGRGAGDGLKAWLKQAAREQDGPVARCRVLTSSCLDVCPADGVAVALMPGNEVLVVDPEADRDALLGRVRAHMAAHASPSEAGGARGAARRVLGRLRGR
ncbi:MAG: hypothetical protein H6742_15445 [Alphaproteobacteria bacterium]|nr:hypothetical protein [Alphaproteobacteria bacterium]